MICLKELWAKNFLSWSSLHINFDEIGMLLITGDNGSGKSSIPSAVTWALFGRTIKGLQTDEVIQWDKDQCSVSLKLDVDGKDVLITRHRGENNDIELQVNKKRIGGTNSDRQRIIQDVVGDFSTCVNTSMFSQGEISYLARATDAERKKIFKKILDLSKFDILYEHVRKIISNLENNIEKLANDKEYIHDQIKRQNVIIEEIKEESENFDKEKEERINELKNQLDEASRSLTRLKKDARRCKYLLSEIEEVNEAEDGQRISYLESSYSSLCQQKARAISDIEDIERQIKALASEFCPTCGQTWPDGADRKTKRTKLHKKLKALLADKTGVDDELDVCKNSLEEIRDRMRESDTKDLKSEYKYIQAKVGDKKASITMLEKSIEREEKKENTLLKKLENQNNFLKELQNKLKENDKVLRKAEQERIYYNAMLTVFSKRGVQSYIMESYFGFLMAVANEYLSVLDPEMSVYISPIRRLKSGETREEIDIIAKRNDREMPYLALSDGQRQRLNVAILFAMHELSRSRAVSDFDTLFLDEVLDISLDQAGQESMAILLKRLQFEHGISKMVVISHNEELKSWFLERKAVKLTDDGSKFV